MNTKKLYVVTLSIVAIMIAFVMGFTFMPLEVFAEEAGEIYYNSEIRPSLFSARNETLSYTRKEVLIDTTMSPKTPNYYDADSVLKNGCAAVAGGIIVGYYDITLENIIPNFSSFLKRGGNIVYKPIDSNIQNLMNDLYFRMKVNTTGAGATEEQFKNGLNEYVVDKGYNITYRGYGQGSKIDYDAIANSFKNGKPVALFITMSNLVTNLEIGDTNLTMTTTEYNANHILIANGIKKVRYFNGSNVIRTDTYLSVSSGLEHFPTGYIWLEGTTAVNDIVGVEIY